MNKLSRQAFTLIELLVVIVIIGILSGLIVVSMSGITGKASVAKSQVFSNSLKNSLLLNLVAEWKFDGNANDSWSGGNDGVWYGSGGGTNTSANYRPSSECISGQCLNFDGSDDYIRFSASTLDFSGNVDYTISGWTKVSGYPVGNIAIAGKWANTGYMVYFPGGGDIRIYANTSYFLGTGIYPNDSNWHYVAGSKSGSFAYLYVDGVLGANGAIGNLITSNSKYFEIGTYNNATGGRFAGSMDDVRIYNTALPISQIKEQYYSGLNSLLANRAIDSTEYYSRIKEFSSIDF